MLVDLRGREKEIKEHDAKVLRERKAKREANGEAEDDDAADDTVYRCTVNSRSPPRC